MFCPDQYELVDFGHGRKWERFCGIDVIRTCPAAEQFTPEQEFPTNAITFDRATDSWANVATLPDEWCIRHGDIHLNLKPTPFGHLGVFCEQSANWDWVGSYGAGLQGLNALNLFAYTGGTTLTLASLGANVVHVDSARNVVNWARRNAESSGLTGAPIRWIVEDALKFVSREIKRGNKYEVIVADPPAIGHAGNRMTWKLERDLTQLFDMLSELASDSLALLLMTCHSAGLNASDLHRLAKTAFGSRFPANADYNNGRLEIVSSVGRKLDCGYFCRVSIPC